MNCESCQPELEEFLYGELTERRAAQMRIHLAACPACAQTHAQLLREQETFNQFYEQTAGEPSGEMWSAIQARLHSEEHAQPSA